MTDAVAHHFDDNDQERSAGTLGMWVFLASELLFFGGLFVVYAVYRWSYPAAFAIGSRELDVAMGTANTAILLASSFTVVLALHATETGHRRRTVLFLVLTILLGLSFLGIKGSEYAAKAEHHLVPGRHFEAPGADARGTELFFSLYFAMTGLHALHMIVGIALMAVLVVKAARGRFTPERHALLHGVGLYWHFVDIVWIFLFPLLYLVERGV